MIISKTPFRISFCGGGSDLAAFYERKGYGAVVSTAIDKFAYIALHRFFENKFVLKYSQTEVSDDVASIKHPLIRECLLYTNTHEPLEITSFADIPSSGSGLGSSSAFSVGLINALLAQQGRMPSREMCADGACQVEIERLGEPIGKQDQYAAAYGGLNYLRFNADGSVHVDPIILPREKHVELSQNLLMFYTGITRKASSILVEQKANMAADDARLRTMVAMRDQADELREELAAGRIDAVGRLMHEGWRLKKEMAAGISNPQFDRIYERARAAGARGGKLLGAGGGGFFLFYCEPAHRAALISELADLRHIDFELERQGTRIIYVDY
ncbi:MAG TPA: galactokinase [Lacunisphaera sp.]|jgi:D-glycero-alpha-D-manno-heptose-7-phosphate kinase